MIVLQPFVYPTSSRCSRLRSAYLTPISISVQAVRPAQSDSSKNVDASLQHESVKLEAVNCRCMDVLLLGDKQRVLRSVNVDQHPVKDSQIYPVEEAGVEDYHCSRRTTWMAEELACSVSGQ